jgi:hypothetical protein
MHGYAASVRQEHIARAIGDGVDASKNESLDGLGADRLLWFPELGVGYYPVTSENAPYNQTYFNKYAGYRATEIGRQLNLARVAMVARHYDGPLLDIGIGDGAFIDARGPVTFGYDVNRAGETWLLERGLWFDPYQEQCDAASLWDALEHVQDFARLLRRVRQFLFVSLPIFRDPEHVLESRHFRPDEHFWYFTRAGLISILDSLGWECVETNLHESAIGREDIESFAFRRWTQL